MKFSRLRPKCIVSLFMITIMVGLTLPLPAFAEAEELVVPEIDEVDSSGEVLVKFKKNRMDVSRFLGRTSLSMFAYAHNLEREDVFEQENLTLLESKGNESTEQLIRRLKKDPNVEYVQPNYQYYPAGITNDPDVGKLWGLDNIRDTDVDSPEAWDLESADQDDVVVAVIDTGVALNHPDLTANLVQGYDFMDNDTSPFDDHDHGTHVAGTIAGVANNGVGITGMSKANNVKVMPLRTNLTTSQIVAAINYAQAHNAKIINASWLCYEYNNGGSHGLCGGMVDFRDQAMTDVIKGFGGLFITAAGNGNGDTDSAGDDHDSGGVSHSYPCDLDLPNVICVAATNQGDDLASFSDYGVLSVDVGAPGARIYSTAPYRTFFEDFTNVVRPDLGPKFTKMGPNETWAADFDLARNNVATGDVNGFVHGTYANNIDSSMVSVPIDLTGKPNPYVKFDYMCNTEPGKDFLNLYFWDGSEYQYITSYTGNVSDTGSIHLVNPNLVDFKVRFQWKTNESGNNYRGCSVDNVSIIADPTSNNGSYQYMSGTSMATPHVAGEAAMIWSYNPSLTMAQVRSVIETTGDSKASLNGKVATGKRINLFNALNVFQPTGAITSTSQSTNGDGLVKVEFQLQDGLSDVVMKLKQFEYSTDGGETFNAPQNGDLSASLSEHYTTQNSFNPTSDPNSHYAFLWSTKHADVPGFDGTDQPKVKVRFKVNDGSKDSAFIISDQFKVDNVTPSATLANTPQSPSTSGTIDVTIEGDGVSTYKYSLDNGALSEDVPVATHIQLANIADGSHIIAVFGKSESGGNVQAIPATYSWLIDTTGPSGTIANASGNPTNTITPTLNLTLIDAGVGENGAEMKFSCNNVDWTDYEPYQSLKNNFNIRSGNYGCTDTDEQKIVYVQYKDSLTNEGMASSVSLVLNTGPVVAQFKNAPSNSSSETSPTFVVDDRADIVSYKFRVDNDAWSDEIEIVPDTPILLQNNLGDGQHTIYLLGKNNAGTWQTEDAQSWYSWLIDTVGTIITLQNTSGSSTNSATPTLELTVMDNGVGTTAAMARFSCDNALWSDFEPFKTIKNDFNVHSGLNGCAVTDGIRIIYAQAKDSVGNIGTSAQTAEFNLDTTAPDITELASSAESVKFKTWTWNSSDNSAIFRFLIDQMANGTPVGDYMALKTATRPNGEGTYYLHVQSKDALGNESAVLTVSAVLDNTPPVATLSGTPNNPTKKNSINVTVSGMGVTHYKYKVDAGNFGDETPIATLIAMSGLANGEHTLEVIGKDVAGNYQSEQLSTRITWKIDTTLPTAVLSGTPTSPTNVRITDITVVGENVNFYKFKVDNGSFGRDTSVVERIRLANLAEGTHQLYILGRKIDGAYIAEAEVTYSWVVDLTPPISTISGTPADNTTATSATLTVGGQDVTHYKYSLDGAEFGSEFSVATAITFGSLSVARHTVRVIGRDAVGNYQASATQVAWTIVSPPVPVITPAPVAPSYSTPASPPPSNPTSSVTIIPSGVLGVQTQLYPDGTIVKVKGKKQYYYIQNGERKLISLLEFKRKYAKGSVVELNSKIIKDIPVAKKKIEVVRSFVKIRKGIGNKKKSIGTAKKGQRFEIIESKNGWYRIVFGGQSQAWIEGKLVKKIN